MLDANVLETAVKHNVAAALAEDLGPGDVSAALIDAGTHARAVVITRTEGIFCGAPWVNEALAQVDQNIGIDWQVKDGDRLMPEQVLFTLNGAAASMLTAERTLLNFVQLLSGTATRTAKYVRLLDGTSTQLLDTRKTMPGLRIAQKYAVACGGGQNHRIGLFDAYLLKENHIAAAGSIGAAVAAAKQTDDNLPVEVEVETLDELQEAIDAAADIAMIDNFSLQQTRKACTLAAGRIKLEASGGIDETSIKDIAHTGVDYISIGDLTKTVTPLDLSMRFRD